MADGPPSEQPRSDSWLTSDVLQQRLGAGLSIELRPIEQNEPPEVEQRRKVLASWITAVVQQPKGIVTTPIIVRNAILVGDLRLPFVEFQVDVRFTGCRFEGEVDFSNCVFFRAAVLDESRFETSVSFSGASARTNLEWSGTEFDGNLNCRGLTVVRSLYAQGAKFRECNLQGTTVGEQAEFNDGESTEPARFRGKAFFDLVQIGGGLSLARTEFGDEVSFQNARIKHFADFSSVTFRGKARMDGLVIDGDARFEGAEFVVGPDGTKIDRIRFPSLHVAGQALFDRVHFGGDVRFDQACFKAEAFFESAQFLGKARFDRASFMGLTRFSRDKGVGSHGDGRTTRFQDGANFTGARASADVHFEEARFSGDISFRDSEFKVVYFRESVAKNTPEGEVRQLLLPSGATKLDLRGFSYERIFLAWNEALDALEPYDVQPYRQMERAFRTIGKDRDADKVYLKQRRRALWYDCRHPTRWLLAAGGLLYWGLARFGVRPLRLAVIPLLLVVYSTFVFSLPQAVAPKKDTGCIAHNLSWKEASGVSLSYFLPVEVPVGACWQAARGTFRLVPLSANLSFLVWATVLRILGWIFVPLGLAALGGFLRRDPPK